MTAHSANIHWHILGAGAIGSLWACYAYRAGRPATLIYKDRSTLAAYQRGSGITARLQTGTDVLPVLATSPELLTAPDTQSQISALLITTKAQHTLDALAAIAPALTPSPLVVLLQNGMGITEPLQQRYPQATLLNASTTEGAYRDGPFSLVHAGCGHTVLGQSQASVQAQEGKSLDETELAIWADSLSVAPLKVSVSDNIDKVLWRKLAINCAINPLTVKYRCRNGELLDNPLAAQDMLHIVEEIVQLSDALGIGDWVTDLLAQVRQVAADTALNRSSMLQDTLAGRETELDCITGELLRRARAANLTLAANQQLYDQLIATQSH